MNKVTEMFASRVFNDTAMKARLSEKTYNAFVALVQNGEPLTREIADEIASAMKDWAIEHDATHYTHWFQPMTGVTAEKHDSFICPNDNGNVIMKFSGKELIKGEGDASSFPHGGLRSTFEARGYTAWDPTCYAFIKDGVLCIPTAFGSYSGQVLDKKTPLLRSTRVLCDCTKKLISLFGEQTEGVTVTVGPEQEYFLIDKSLFQKRKDLIFTGRTLFGAKPPKGQELEDHYFGSIRPRVLKFMAELDEELWKLGVLAKTRHNEAAPAQHELAPIFTVANVAADHNQLTMECMKKIADKHSLACLLHEKPFMGVNGSGKHNNWSLATVEGKNLFTPGKNPQDNLLFLTLLVGVVRAVDIHQDLLRLSVASAGNDHRLGASEAPPAIISIYLGDELTSILESFASGTKYEKKDAHKMNMGVDVIPSFNQDTSDRNRTSPLAFTGNKFEFRMLGSSTNISCPNVMLNTAIAETFDEFYEELKNAKDFQNAVKKLIQKTYNAHQRIIFNGNGYSSEWTDEASRRGLLNLPSTPEALMRYTDEKNLKLLKKYGIYTGEEVSARQEILLENYCKVINIEAQTMLEMSKTEIIPATINFSKTLAETIISKKSLNISSKTETELLQKISMLIDATNDEVNRLEQTLITAQSLCSIYKRAEAYRDAVLSSMNKIRSFVDTLETLMPRNEWPFPTYSDLLFSV